MTEGREWITPYIEPDFSMGCSLEYEYERRAHFPLILFMNVHNACNAVCDMCPKSKQTDPCMFMDWDLYRKIIDEFSDKGGEVVVLSPHAEPFADKKVIEYIRYATLKGLKFYFMTNMRGLNEQTLQTMINFGLSAKFEISFPGIFEETYRKTTGNGVWESLQNTQNLKKKYGNIGYIRAIKHNFLPFEEEVVKFYWNYHGLGVVLEEPHDWAGVMEKENKTMKRIGMGCVYLLNGMMVDVDGIVLLCPMDIHKRHRIGNLKESTIQDLWNQSELKIITEEVFKKKNGGLDILCNHCHRICI